MKALEIVPILNKGGHVKLARETELTTRNNFIPNKVSSNISLGTIQSGTKRLRSMSELIQILIVLLAATGMILP